MNILYIGPYKNIGTLSYASIDIIDTLNRDPRVSKLSIKPIYLNDKIRTNHDMVISNLENSKYLDHYDFIIQHGPVGLLSHYISSNIKNVAIPLIDKIYNKKTYIDILSNFNYVLVDSDEYYDFLSGPSYNLSNVKQYSYQKMYSASQTINFHLFQQNKKIYSIGNYDLSLVEKIITSFYISFYDRDDISLLIFINGQNTNQEQVNKMLDSLKEKLNLKNTINNINIFIKELDDKELSSIHASCDIFIDLLASNIESNLNRFIAQSNNNHIITLSDIETYQDIKYNNFVINETIPNFSDLSLSSAMLNSINHHCHKPINNTTITDILCL
jgi:hypothetical protein